MPGSSCPAASAQCGPRTVVLGDHPSGRGSCPCDDVAMTDLPLTGGCNCGAVRYEVSAPLVAASYCHCRRCQRRSGAAASPNAHPAPGTFRIVRARTTCAFGSRTTAARSGSVETAAPPSLDTTPATPTRSGSAWAPSTRTPGSVRTYVSSSGMRPHGKRSPTTGCRGIPTVATPFDSTRRHTRRTRGARPRQECSALSVCLRAAGSCGLARWRVRGWPTAGLLVFVACEGGSCRLRESERC